MIFFFLFASASSSEYEIVREKTTRLEEWLEG